MTSRGNLMVNMVNNQNISFKTTEGIKPSEKIQQNEHPNLKVTVEDSVETNEVEGLFEGETIFESISDLFSSDDEEEYRPDLNDLSSSDADESFVLKVKEDSKPKTSYKNKCDDKDIISGTDSDESAVSFLQRVNKHNLSENKNNSSSNRPKPSENNQSIDETALLQNVNSVNNVNSVCVDIVNLPNESINEQPRKKTKVFNLPEKQCKKRERNSKTWKKNKAKLDREQGKAYTSQKGNFVEGKKMNNGLLCNEKCRFNCSGNFSLEQRLEIFSSFYKLDVNSKNNLLFKSILPVNVKRHKKNSSSQKRHSYQFFVRSNMADVRVCKKALCSLYQVSVKKIDLLQAKMEDGASAPPSDRRGHHMSRPHKVTQNVRNYVHQHIQSFPGESSHYSRHRNPHKKYLSPLLNLTKMYDLYINQCELENKPINFKIKLCTYRNIFNSDFNFSFGNPRSDTCSTCDAGENTEEHEVSYREAFENQKTDREKARTNNKISYITVDLQQTMPLPRLTTSRAFYLRQLWFYNLGVHIIAKGVEKADFCTWTEDIANRGSNEVASSLLTLFELDDTFMGTDQLIIWSDSCAGQNKNILLVLLYQYLVLKKRFKTIDHKYPEVGHSYLDSDRDFGQIEKILRKQENVYTPDQYRHIVASANKKNLVVDMKPHFRNFDNMFAKLNLTHRKTNLLHENVRFRDGIKWIRVEEYGSYLYKETYDEYTPFKKVSLLKTEKLTSKKCNVQHVLENVSIDRVQKPYGVVSKEKICNLKDQLKFVKEDHRWFYENIFQEQDKKENADKSNECVNKKRKRKTV